MRSRVLRLCLRQDPRGETERRYIHSRIPCQEKKTYPEHCARDKVVVLEGSTKDPSHSFPSLVKRRPIIVRLK